MNMKSIAFISSLTLCSSTIAASTTTTATTTTNTTAVAANNGINKTAASARKSFLQTLKDSNLGFAYYNVSKSAEAGKKFDGLRSTHYVYMNYKVGKGRFTLRPGISTQHSGKDKGQKPKYAGLQLRYYQFSILNEKDHGVGYMAQIRNSFLTKASRNQGTETLHYYLGSLSKSFGKFSLSSAHYIGWYNNRSGYDNKGNKNQDGFTMATLSGSYSVTDKFYVALGNTFSNDFTNYENETLSNNTIRTEPEIGYTFKSGLALSASYNMLIYSKEGGSSKYERVQDPLKKGSIYGTLWYTFF